MKNKYLFVTILLVVLAITGFGFTKAYMEVEEQKEEELLIVTSFYPMYIATLNIVGTCEGVTVETLSEPQTGCLHDYQLTAQDMILLSEADIFVVNGGGIENFLTDVAREYPNLTIINAGEKIFGDEIHDENSHIDEVNHSEESHIEEHIYEANHSEESHIEEHIDEANHSEESHIEETSNIEELHIEEHIYEANHSEESHIEDSHDGHNHGENAHIWMSIAHYMEQVKVICEGLIAADPVHRTIYEKETVTYLEKIEKLHQQAEGLAKTVQGKQLIIFHEAFEFLAEDLGMHVAGELNLDEERQVSAGEIADILHVIKSKKMELILAENLYGKDIGDTIEKETSCKVYYLDTLVRGDGSKDSWLQGMEKNLQILETALLVEE